MARTPRARTKNATPMALAFTAVTQPEHEITRVAWSPAARPLLEAMDASLRPFKENLPVRDLRHRLQVRDAGVIRVDRSFGRGQDPSLLLTRTDTSAATAHANAAVAEWARDAVGALERVDRQAAAALRTLALAGDAVMARVQRTRVFDWETQRQNGSAKPRVGSQFADLADYVAVRLAGQEVYPGAGPMRRVVGADLGTNRADLMSGVITLDVKDTQVRFSVGLTVSVETYPGRPLPVVQLRHKKFVWAREPRAGRDDSSGFVLPHGEDRALRFTVGEDLSLTEEYRALARRYDLPLGATAADLALLGTSGPHHVVITHRNGRAESDAALRGITDLDRRLSFERATELLAPLGLTPWAAIQEIPTYYGKQSDADMDWKSAFEDAPDDEALLDDTTRAKLELAEQKFSAWAARMGASITDHYAGTHQLVIGYQSGLQEDALKAEAILQRILRDTVCIHLEALPDGVHGPRSGEKGVKAAERAHQRALAWRPFVSRLRQLQDETGQPLHGVLVMAREWYDQKHDDVVNKRAARVTLSRELGLTVQYLLPRRTKKDGTPHQNADRDFRVRTVNAWRDLAWKTLGKMHAVQVKLDHSLSSTPQRLFQPPVLGVGILRTNRTDARRNAMSFIPYAIELDTQTGVCTGSVMLRDSDGTVRTTDLMPLPRLVQELTANGPSELARGKTAADTEKLRRELVQTFLHQVISARAAAHPDLIVLIDGGTLSGMWPWITDANMQPGAVRLGSEPHAEQDFPGAALVRLRPNHAPKVIMDTKQVQICVDGVVRPSATWSDADLYRVTDTGKEMPTYLSFGSRIFKGKRSASTYQTITEEDGTTVSPYTDAWLTPNAIEITVVRCQHHAAEDLAKLIEALRSEYAHFGSWSNAPGPLHFASFLKEYVPDYELAEDDEDEETR